MSRNMAAWLIVGITWLLVSAAVAHHKMTRPNTPEKARLVERIRDLTAIMPAWLCATVLAIVLPFAPLIAVSGWIERMFKAQP